MIKKRRRRGESPPGTSSQPQYDITRRVLTYEDWAPTVNGCVDVLLRSWPNGYWRVSVWGGDDTYMGATFGPGEYQRARDVYDRIVDWSTQDQMRSWGLRMND